MLVPNDIVKIELDDPASIYFNVKLNFKASLFSSILDLSAPSGGEMRFYFFGHLAGKTAQKLSEICDFQKLV